MARVLMKGNEAAAEALLRAGGDFFAGYPITPSSEVLEYLSHRMPDVERPFIQAENEISAFNMLLGAAACGARAFTASSGPGVSLMAEGMSYAAREELPFVLLNVQRWGCGLGDLSSGQTDYMRDVKGGGHGDFHQVVFAPSSIQEMVDMIYETFEVAEKWRVGVTVLTEGYLGQMMENVELPPFKKREIPLGWGVDGTGDVTTKISPNTTVEVERRRKVYTEIVDTMQRWEDVETEDAEYVLVAFGLPGRVCIDAVKRLRERGEKVGLIRPKLLWPFPLEAFKKLPKTVKGFISVESSDFGMLVQDVALSAKVTHPDAPVWCYAHSLGIPNIKNVTDYYDRVINGEERRVY